MKTDINGGVTMIDAEIRKQIAAAGEGLFGRLVTRVAGLKAQVEQAAPTCSPTCEVAISNSNRYQVLARHRDPDALKAAVTALKRARLQVVRGSRKGRLQVGKLRASPMREPAS